MSSLQLVIIAVFWVSFAGIAYSYAFYPILLVVIARVFGQPFRHASEEAQDGDGLPSISLLVVACDEESVIERRVQNALELDYPREKLEIVVASDGSTDRTAAILRQFAAQNVRLLDYPSRRGKASVLNDALTELRHPIVLLSDANTSIRPNAARRLVRWFDDPAIGAVCGKLVIVDNASGNNVDSLYWKYETFLKMHEGRLGALLGSNGAIYAIRGDLFPSIPASTIVDDFVVPLLAKQQTRCAIVYEHTAIAYEQSAPDVSAEFQRRARIGAGGWQAMSMLWRLLNPARGWVAFTFFSHKVLRWLCPFFMVLLLAANVPLLTTPLYRAIFCLQLAFYTAAAAGAWVPRAAPAGKLLRLANMFVMMNAALLLGFIRWLSIPQTGAWDRTSRVGENESPETPPCTPDTVI